MESFGHLHYIVSLHILYQELLQDDVHDSMAPSYAASSRGRVLGASSPVTAEVVEGLFAVGKAAWSYVLGEIGAWRQFIFSSAQQAHHSTDISRTNDL
jgi:hypothetical protein